MSAPASDRASLFDADTRAPVAARVVWFWSLTMALLICTPLLLHRGFALTHDMVFVPDQPYKGAWLGLDGSVPRAVPVDAVVSVLSRALPGDLLQKAVLVSLLLLGGVGAARLVPQAALVGRLAAATLFVWNPYVFERLAMGQWALLCGYAALPWVAVGALRVRSGRRHGWPWLCLAMAVAASTSPTGGALVALVCCFLVLGASRSMSARALALSLAVNLPWVVPSLLYRGGIPADTAGVAAFAAHSDTPYGVVGSLVSLGGSWNSDVVPPGRGSWLLSGCLLLLCVAALVGVRCARPVSTGLPVARLALLAALGFALALLPALPGGLAVMQEVDAHVPGAGLLRDSQKWIALLALLESLGLAAGISWLALRWRRHGAQASWWLVATSMLLPMAVMPALAWGLAGRLSPVSYPRDWAAVARLLQDAPHARGGGGDVAVLPWSIYRRFRWNGDRPVLDPAPRFLPGEVVIADTLVVGAEVVTGESSRAARIGRLLTAGDDVTVGLERLGIAYVVVESGTPGLGRSVSLSGDVLYDGRWLKLWSLGSPAGSQPSPPGPAAAAAAAAAGQDPGLLREAAILAADVVAGVAVAGSAAMLMSGALRRYSRRRSPRP